VVEIAGDQRGHGRPAVAEIFVARRPPAAPVAGVEVQITGWRLADGSPWHHRVKSPPSQRFTRPKHGGGDGVCTR